MKTKEQIQTRLMWAANNTATIRGCSKGEKTLPVQKATDYTHFKAASDILEWVLKDD